MTETTNDENNSWNISPLSTNLPLSLTTVYAKTLDGFVWFCQVSLAMGWSREKQQQTPTESLI